ncbi:MAG: 4-hydroxythreonine-4-phosphate dehydrogenase PdxA [Candidatus Omnitrophica bacterium CG11_big_fil_rev_8_21_14_0_20_63_9]|nr:MAG: 4-hydroxythreonine-4-phosphate dehydrogenase PdxA [Candidatus Omnitrophica bacterium CG11_big_fil_rev_8_21_14_0_20_63_9]
MSAIRVLAITAGDPAGIGPEVILKSLARWRPPARVRLAVIGDLAVFAFYARRLKVALPRWQVVHGSASLRSKRSTNRLMFLDTGHRMAAQPGRSTAATGAAALRYLDSAVHAWRRGALDGLVTAPVTKWAIARVQPSFVGHTEYLARAMRARDVAMMFASQQLRVVLLTRHVPLRRVAGAITPALVRSVVRLTWDGLRTQFGVARPRVVLCGVNPHAGEQGRCGDEERRVLEPALRALRRQGIRCDGPVAADGLFGSRAAYDAVICAYHDQGLGPFKLAARDTGCQVTLGLPVVRTSPDHGSALEIAGQGRADPGSMIYALTLATRLACSPPRR